MKVSIAMISYKHEAFIERAINSILEQKCDFEYEIVLGDDGSPDGTQNSIKDFQKRYPDIIKPILREKNIGAVNNLIDTLNRCTGEYVALLEGDDYWSDPSKLQKQVDYLDTHPHVVISAHNTTVLLSDGTTYLHNKKEKYASAPYHSEYSIEDYIIKDFFHTSSIVYRRNALDGFPDWYRNVFAGDFFLVLLTGRKGPIHYINEALSVYRINDNSISHYSTRMEIFRNYLKHLTIFDNETNGHYHKWIEGKKFSLAFGIHYYYPNYLRKFWFTVSNLGKIARLDSSVISKIDRWKILLPTRFLRSKVNLNKKKQN